MRKNFSKSNKIKGLEELKALGFLVPDFDFIPDYTELGLSDVDINLNYPPSCLFDIVKKKLKKLDGKYGISLRSASFDEDGTNQSAAGRYLSFNGLCDIESIVDAVLRIWLHHRQNSKNVLCPLIVQQTHPSFYSGVAFKDKEMIVIESYFGACSNVVDGSINPYITMFQNGKRIDNFKGKSNYCYLYRVHPSVFKNKIFEIGQTLKPKATSFTTSNYVHSVVNNKTVLVSGVRPNKPINFYDEKIIPQLLEVLSALDNEDGVDIEWGTDIDGNLYLYQYRKLTSKINNLDVFPQSVAPIGTGVIQGIPVSPGNVQGILREEPSVVGDDTILYLVFDNVSNINSLKNVKGVISCYGGVLSHLSIICRELNIPCVVGVDTQLPLGKTVEIDGKTGVIQILE